MEWKLEVVIIPVADQDRAKEFYVEQLGWGLVSDYRAGETFRVVQVLPPGSACAIVLANNPEAAGSVQGLHLVVNDIVEARRELEKSGAAASEVFHFVDGAQAPGPHPERQDYNSYFTFTDPDGTGWMVQEVGRVAIPA